MEGDDEGGLRLLAIVTSRPEALVIATMLEAHGILVDVGATWHASVDPISVGLGGHHIRVPACDHGIASELIREVGLPESDVAFAGARYAVQKLLAVYVGLQLFIMVPAAIAGWFPLYQFGLLPLQVLGVQVDPRGRNDYLLSEPQ